MRTVLLATLYLLPTAVWAQEMPPASAVARAVTVQSTALQDVGPWGARALPEGLAPLASDLWRNSDPATLGFLLGKISADQRFPSLQSLTRRAVFSGGAAPTSDPDVTRARFEAANRLGPAEASAQLIFGVPRLSSQTSLAVIAIDAGLRVGRTAEACSLLESVVAQPQGTQWLEARAACYALNNEAAAANLSVDLAKSQGLTDTWLGRAIAAVGGPLTAPPPFRVDSGRAIALSLSAKLKPPLTIVNHQDPMAISALAIQPDFMASLTPQERLALATNGAGRGVVSLSALARFQLAPNEITDASTDLSIPANVDPTTNALPIPAQISQKIRAAPSLGARAVQAQLALGAIKAIMTTQPGLMTVADVPVLAEAALWSGEGALARSIANLLPEPLDGRLALVSALYDLAGKGQGVEARLNLAGADPVARRLATRDILVAWSAGVSGDDGTSMLVQSGLPWAPAGNAGLRAALDLAAGRGSKGEVILLTAFALQGVDPALADPETLIVAIRALRKVGLQDGARDLARDYLLAGFVTLPQRQTTRPRAGPPPIAPALRPVGPSAAPQTSAPAPTPRTPPTTRATQRPVARTPAIATPPAATPAGRNKPTWGTP
jgi:hypothetical protein